MVSGKSVLNMTLCEAAEEDIQAHCRATKDTREDLARAIGVAYSTLSNYLNGHYLMPAVVIIKLARVTGQGNALQVLLQSCEQEQQVSPCSIGELLGVVAAAAEADTAATTEIITSLPDGVDPEELRRCDARMRKAQAMRRRLSLALHNHAAAAPLSPRAPQRARTLADTPEDKRHA